MDGLTLSLHLKCTVSELSPQFLNAPKHLLLLNRNVIFKNYNMVARVVAGFHQLSYFQLHCGGASGGDGLHEHNLVV